MADATEVHKVEVEVEVPQADSDQLRFALGLQADGDIAPF